MSDFRSEYNINSTNLEVHGCQESLAREEPARSSDQLPANPEFAYPVNQAPVKKKRRQISPLMFLSVVIFVVVTTLSIGYLNVNAALTYVTENSAGVFLSALWVKNEQDTAPLTYELIERMTNTVVATGLVSDQDAVLSFNSLKSSTGYALLIYNGQDLVKQFPFFTSTINNKITQPSAAATPTAGQTPATGQTTAQINANSSIVSQGVNLDDLGNITNGQFYFNDGNQTFYASFSPSNAAHIYRSIPGETTKSIFDGFGWSLVAHKSWLYFSGNQGTKIDGTYNLFRIKADGSGLERLNSAFCYGMSIYGDYLYYNRKDNTAAANLSICRSGLDGKNEQVLETDFNGYCVVYENALYYTSKNGTFYRAKPDGTEKKAVLTEKIKYAVISNGRLVYIDTAGNLKTADIDGQNSRQVLAAGTKPISAVNSVGDTLIYAVYDPIAVAGRYAYHYELYQVIADGSGNKLIYTGLSAGTYFNIINNKIYVLDYAVDPASGQMPAIARSMDLNGNNVSDLDR